LRRIGLLGGISAAASADYYRFLNNGANVRLGRNHAAEVVLWSFDFQALLDLVERPKEIEVQFAAAANALADVGCTGLAVASVTGHRFIGQIADDSRFELVHIGDVVASRLTADAVRRPAVLATAQTLADELLMARLTGSRPAVRVPEDLENRLDDTIFSELANAQVSQGSRQLLDEIQTALDEMDADAVVLACTELSLANSVRPFGGRVYDSARLHCEAILDVAVASGAFA